MNEYPRIRIKLDLYVKYLKTSKQLKFELKKCFDCFNFLFIRI